MDAGRFGRALGGGARETAKALVKAADAAAAPSPSAARTGAQEVKPVPAAAMRGQAAGVKTVRTATGLKQGGKRFGEAIWGPFAKLSGVLWLEVTGVLFGMFAGVAGLEAWKGRGAFAARVGTEHEGFALLMMVVFGWFTVSSFLRAGRRSRQGSRQ